MAVESIPYDATLQLVYDLGVDGAGKSISRRRSFSNIKQIVTDQVIYDVASSMLGLQQDPVTQILVIDKVSLVSGI